jgi:hypothetical protein
MECIVREAIVIELHPYNINREGGFCLSKTWKAFIGSLKLLGHDPVTFLSMFTNNPNPKPTLPLKLGISLCSLAIYKPTPLSPTPLLSESSIWYSMLMLPFPLSISSQRTSVASHG